MGYKKALETYNIPFEKELVFATEHVTFEEGYAYAQEIFENYPTVDGIFCITDLVAAGVLTYCNEHNIKVPEHVKIIGFSNWHLSQLISPALSTVEQPDSEMGVAAFSLLLEEINAKRNNTPFEKRIVTLNTQVIARQSTLY
jgi:LacI family transcriptional regulator